MGLEREYAEPSYAEPSVGRAERPSEVYLAHERLHSALERLDKHSVLLTERLTPYLTDDQGVTANAVLNDQAAAVQAAQPILQAASIAERIADHLASVRERFQG